MDEMDKPDQALKVNFDDATIMVIEDNLDDWFFIRSALKECLPNVQSALFTAEEEAVRHLIGCTTQEWDLPKLILLDLYLPDRATGWRLLQQIKTMPGSVSRVPVVMLSRSDRADDIAEGYQRGCASYLVKPGLFSDWLSSFDALRTYWWETATLPKLPANYRWVRA